MKMSEVVRLLSTGRHDKLSTQQVSEAQRLYSGINQFLDDDLDYALIALYY